jgi:hypothetical protein
MTRGLANATADPGRPAAALTAADRPGTSGDATRLRDATLAGATFVGAWGTAPGEAVPRDDGPGAPIATAGEPSPTTTSKAMHMPIRPESRPADHLVIFYPTFCYVRQMRSS